ncbi:SHOCT domain-containing protein [Paenibacillus motobuensis]|uniref:SHOCT domain-containing protein n=1 Tax=Paenibacillus motobuensis TaxID=295324 RepID=A0ABN0YJS2_9BACL
MSKLYNALTDRVNKREVMDWAEGLNGLVAVTKSNVYLVRGGFMEKEKVKTYILRGITSIQAKRPTTFTNGHFQIISSGVGDKTSRYGTINYALDENTVMIRSNFDHFLRLEQLIYKIQSEPQVVIANSVQEVQKEEDTFVMLEKLKKLREMSAITEAEYEEKRKELLSRI